MTIKKLVVGSMFPMLLGSEMAAADWGDVYYCNMDALEHYGNDRERRSGAIQSDWPTAFKLDQAKNALVFGDSVFLMAEYTN